MHILVTNDDGVYAPGILILAQALSEVGDVTIFAPRENQSAAGHRKTLRTPLRADKVTLPDGTSAFATDGSPADCVALAKLGLVDTVDLVVSGINNTWNLGQDLTYSGTVTAAMEAAVWGLPALAVSVNRHPEPNLEVAAKFTARLAREVMARGLPRHTLLNVNVPDGTPKGVKITRQGTRVYRDELVSREDPYGRAYYWIGGDVPTGLPEEEGSDFWAVTSGYVSITPVNLDMTQHGFMADLERWGLKPGE